MLGHVDQVTRRIGASIGADMVVSCDGLRCGCSMILGKKA